MATNKEIKKNIKHSITQIRNLLTKIEKMSTEDEYKLLAAYFFTESLMQNIEAGELSAKNISKKTSEFILHGAKECLK